ncbi:hypothetical protein GIB67_031079 [Kingdonia uniflora]|uniref:Magnesium transporter n=1 Tax=Kingdonia uniflora TaxID=39325 RepID=A0A7J7LCI4_9MAGN|nr:hypothetical protein GIB67_031079 [Kingdonia uniflora]
MRSGPLQNSLDDELNRHQFVMHHPQTKRKCTGIRAWLVISTLGQSHLEEVDKHSIMRRTGLPARDLRVLDPQLSYPSSILGREKAIVINLEHIKAIVTASEVLVLNSTDPSVAPFVHDLQHRVSNSNDTSQQATESSDTEMEVMERPFSITLTTNTEIRNSNPRNTVDVPAVKILPFEFKALEVCLESACKCLESETSTLELEAYPALDELTSKISTLNLERVRQIKSRLVAMSGRVQKVNDNMRDEDGKTEDSYEDLSYIKPNVEELEMLLEAYFAQIDGTLQKLSTVCNLTPSNHVQF